MANTDDGESRDSAQVRVIDKRRFSDSGDTVAGGDGDRAESRAEDLGRAATRPSVDKNSSDVGGSSGSTSSEYQPVDFSSFVVSLATQAFALLGEVQHPELQHIPVNTAAARQMIDVIAMLHDRTKGNLTPDEEKLIGDALTSLRLAFVRRTRGG